MASRQSASAEVHLTPSDLAERWTMSRQTLANMRSRGEGPRWIRCGRLVRYRLNEIEAHEEAQAHGPRQ